MCDSNRYYVQLRYGGISMQNPSLERHLLWIIPLSVSVLWQNSVRLPWRIWQRRQFLRADLLATKHIVIVLYSYFWRSLRHMTVLPYCILHIITNLLPFLTTRPYRDVFVDMIIASALVFGSSIPAAKPLIRALMHWLYCYLRNLCSGLSSSSPRNRSNLSALPCSSHLSGRMTKKCT